MARLPQEAVFEPVRRCDQLVEREALAGLLGDGVTDVGVGVDERREDHVVGVDARLLDPDDLVVGDDDPAFDRLELRTDQNGPFKVHTRRSPARE